MSKRGLGSFSLLLCNVTLELCSAVREVFDLRFCKELIEAAELIYGAERFCSNLELVCLTHSLGVQLGLEQVRQEAALGFDVGVADIVPCHGTCAGEFTKAGHGLNLCLELKRAVKNIRRAGI